MALRKYALVDLLPEYAHTLALQLYMDLRKALIDVATPLPLTPTGIEGPLGGCLDLMNAISSEIRMELQGKSCIIVPQTIYAMPSVRKLVKDEGVNSSYRTLAVSHSKRYSFLLKLTDRKEIKARPYQAEGATLRDTVGSGTRVCNFSSENRLRCYVVTTEKEHQAPGAVFENTVGYEHPGQFSQWVRMTIPRQTFDSMSHRYEGYVLDKDTGVYNNDHLKIQLVVQ